MRQVELNYFGAVMKLGERLDLVARSVEETELCADFDSLEAF